jgi:hypothetical protein
MTAESQPTTTDDNRTERMQQQQQQQQQRSILAFRSMGGGGGDDDTNGVSKRKMSYQLSELGDGMNFRIPTTVGVSEHVQTTHPQYSWQYRTLHFLHSPTMQYAFAGLLLLDILVLFGELLVLSYFPHCSVIVRDAVSCCYDSNNSNHTNNSNETILQREENPNHEAELCIYPSVPNSTYSAGCDEERYHGVHLTELTFFYMTITILSIFMIELTISMIALTPAIFFRQFFFALDFIIISVSLILEITFHVLGDDLYQSLSGLLVVIRIWRFIRIGHGIVELTNEAAHKEDHHLMEYTKELRAIILQHNLPLPDHPEMESFFDTANTTMPTFTPQLQQQVVPNPINPTPTTTTIRDPKTSMEEPKLSRVEEGEDDISPS